MTILPTRESAMTIKSNLPWGHVFFVTRVQNTHAHTLLPYHALLPFGTDSHAIANQATNTHHEHTSAHMM